MLRNIFKSTIRVTRRSWFISLLNISGLSIGIASFLLIFQYVELEKSYDDFHQNAERIFRVSHKFYKDGQLDFHAAATFPRVGPALKNEFAEVENSVRLMRKFRGGVVRYEDKSFREENLIYVDPSFFNIFSF